MEEEVVLMSSVIKLRDHDLSIGEVKGADLEYEIHIREEAPSKEEEGSAGVRVSPQQKGWLKLVQGRFAGCVNTQRKGQERERERLKNDFLISKKKIIFFKFRRIFCID